MMTRQRFFVLVFSLAAFGASTAKAGEVRWVDAVSVPANGYAVFNGKCKLSGRVCPSAVPVTGPITVGRVISGMKIGAIKCEKQTKTRAGWRGGPEFVAIAGRWNCKASINKRAVDATPGPNGDRPFPWAIVVGAKI